MFFYILKISMQTWASFVLMICLQNSEAGPPGVLFRLAQAYSTGVLLKVVDVIRQIQRYKVVAHNMVLMK
jgi:hypothetical protein